MFSCEPVVALHCCHCHCLLGNNTHYKFSTIDEPWGAALELFREIENGGTVFILFCSWILFFSSYLCVNDVSMSEKYIPALYSYLLLNVFVWDIPYIVVHDKRHYFQSCLPKYMNAYQMQVIAYIFWYSSSHDAGLVVLSWTFDSAPFDCFIFYFYDSENYFSALFPYFPRPLQQLFILVNLV